MSRVGFWLAPFFVVGCAEVLGADFDDTELLPYDVTLVLAPHPHDAADAGPSSTGTGKVESSDARLDCDKECSARFAKQDITLTAEPDSDSAFAGWRTFPATSCDGVRDPVCVLTIDRSVRVEAYFVTRGANVWFTHFTGAALDSALAVDVDGAGASVAAGTFDGKIVFDGDSWQSLGATDAFVISSDAGGRPRGSWTLATSQSDTIYDVALDENGVVAVGAAGDLGGGEWSDATFGFATLQGRRAVVVALGVENVPSHAMPLRWAWFLPGLGSAELNSVAIANGRVFALGTVEGEVSEDPAVISDGMDPDILFASFEADGALRFLFSLGGSSLQTALPIVIQSSGNLVVSGEAGEGLFPNVRGGDCPVLEGMFLARFDQDGACIDAKSFGPPNAMTAWAIKRATPGDDLILAAHSQLPLEIVPGVAASAVPENTTFVCRLDPAGNWAADRSWLVRLSGVAGGKAVKVTSLGSMGDQTLVGLLLNGDIHLGEITLAPADGRGLDLVALGPQGTFRWHRSWGALESGVYRDITPHPESHTWFLAAETLTYDWDTKLDFESVTQEPFVLDQWDAVVARVAP